MKTLAEFVKSVCLVVEDNRTTQFLKNVVASAFPGITIHSTQTLKDAQDWIHQRTDHYPTEAQLQQVHEQMLHSSADAQPSILLQQWVIERQRHRLCLRPATRRYPPTEPITLVWQGEDSLVLPEWQGMLVFATGEGVGVDPEWLRLGPLSVRARTGGERVQLHPKRPSRTLKNLFQESNVPASQRPWLPLVYVGERLVFAAGVGMDIRTGLADGGVVLRWDVLPERGNHLDLRRD